MFLVRQLHSKWLRNLGSPIWWLTVSLSLLSVLLDILHPAGHWGRSLWKGMSGSGRSRSGLCISAHIFLVRTSCRTPAEFQERMTNAVTMCIQEDEMGLLNTQPGATKIAHVNVPSLYTKPCFGALIL